MVFSPAPFPYSGSFLLRYRALYAYSARAADELTLREGDVVYVMERCDDGWYVGTSQRTHEFGTFPGNYVQRCWYVHWAS